MLVKQPSRKEDHGANEVKDPDVWEPPTPKPAQMKAKWGIAAAGSKPPNRRGAGAAGGAGRGNPLGAYGNVDN